MAITLFNSASNPADGGSVAAATVTITPPASMAAGDLVVVVVGNRTTTATLSVGVTGGQTWNDAGQLAPASSGPVGVWWCRFNGTWDANPRFDSSVSVGITGVMHVFRPTDAANLWAVDVALISDFYAAPASPFTVTITGVTPPAASTVAFAIWSTLDDNTWGSLSGTGWVVTGTAQYRNLAGTDMSLSFAHKIQTSSAATGNVSKNQATLGGDSGKRGIIAWREVVSGQQFTITLDEAVGAADAEPRQTGKALPDAAALADTLSRLTGRSLAEATALADAITKAPGRVLVDGVAMADTVGAERIIVRELLEALGMADVLAKVASRTVVEGVTLADLVERLTTRQLTDSAAVADVLSRLTGRPLSETASLADTLTATLIVEHTVLEAVATVDDVVVTVGRVLVDTATVADVLSRVTGRALVEAVAIADVATKAVTRGLLDQVAVTDALTVLWIRLRELGDVVALQDVFASELQVAPPWIYGYEMRGVNIYVSEASASGATSANHSSGATLTEGSTGQNVQVSDPRAEGMETS